MSNTFKDKLSSCIGMDLGLVLTNGIKYLGKLKSVGDDYITTTDIRMVEDKDKNPTEKQITIQANIPFDKIAKIEFVDFDEGTNLPNVIALKQPINVKK